MLAAYVSGHGYGHATRVGEVLREVRRREPSIPIAIVTSGPERLYRRAISGAFEVRSEACDVGLAQKSALVIDEGGTVDAWWRFQAGYDARRGAEGAGARHVQARQRAGPVPVAALRRRHQAHVFWTLFQNLS